uniref:RNA helicase n=1 Tax=Astyanax mexicanus TaxID=7994 RepID=A0A8B9REV3_ASTMX
MHVAITMLLTYRAIIFFYRDNFADVDNSRVFPHGFVKMRLLFYRVLQSLLETPLSFQNYADRFHLLLYLEEAQMLVDIKRYNKENVTMTQDKQNKKLLELEVPGVSENRPSVLRGDHLLLTKSEDLNLPFVTKYKGYVHRVELDKLKLGFSSNPLSLSVSLSQVEKCIPGARILACAPSNSAADQLCEKLLPHVDSHKVYRIYALSRSPDCCNLSGDDYEYPSKEELMDYKILVTTAYTAGRLVTGGLPAGHFTHIFVDEAGHAVESEAIIGIAGLLRAETGQLVLAGDPKQLGPILRSPIAIQYGLGLSLLERLMTKNPLYQKGETGFNPRYVTKLLQNYRSHRSILKIPNEMFYDGELQARADEYSTSLYCNWEHLPKRGFPLIFHGVQGKDERESSSPSFFNTTEITKVIDYLKKLLLTQGKKGIAKISPKDIGIITPYRKQVEKLRKAIRMCDKELKVFKGIDELKVGSVEEFQGQERRVIIVSTVRSSGEYINIDTDFNIGFLNNEKRFNVAMTRAKSLLIVVGNPIILSSDSTWSRFIQYCTDEGGYTGMNRTNIEGTDEIIVRIAALSLQMAEEGE